jgi:hypothetical protein
VLEGLDVDHDAWALGADVAVISHASSSALFVYPARTTGQAVTVTGCSVAIVGDLLPHIAALAGNG